MFDKKEYREIIRQGQIQRGYVSKPSFEDKLKEIIDDSFEELPILLKNKEEEILQKYEDKDINELTDEEITEYEKCLPEYIQNLPGSLRSTDPKELKSRVDAIDKRLDELEEEIEEEQIFQDNAQEVIDEATQKKEEAQKNLDDYHKQEDDYLKNEETLQGEALDDASKIRDDFSEVEEDYDVPQRIRTIISMIGTEFDDYPRGLLYTDEVEGYKQVADDLDDFANDLEIGSLEDWETTTIGKAHKVAQSIRDYADKYDVNKHKLGDDLSDLMSIAGKGQPSEWQNIIDESDEIIERNTELMSDSVKTQTRKEKERNDLQDNKKKSEDRLSQAERNLYNIP